jgi:hypothetical protein
MDEQAVIDYIMHTFEGVDRVSAMDAHFFPRDPEKHWPNFATIVTTDAHDDASDLNAPGRFRLNIGVGRATFASLFPEGTGEPDYTVLDTVMPHPVYAAQHWVAIINPSEATFQNVVAPLLEGAYKRLAPKAERE